MLAAMVMTVACAAQAAQSVQQVRLRHVNVVTGKDTTRATFDFSGNVQYHLFQLHSPDRVVLDFTDTRLDPAFHAPTQIGSMKDIRTARHGRHGVRVVLDMQTRVRSKSFLQPLKGGRGYRLTLNLTPLAAAHQVASQHSVQQSMSHRASKVLIAIDPGHGGRDSGAIGPNGLEEKTVTLAVGKRLAKLINEQPGMRAILTRTGDYYVPLEKRFEIARAHKANLFVSIHANSCPDHCHQRGASVWSLSVHGKVSEAGRWLARSENAADLIGGVNLDDKSHTLASLLLDLSQGASMHASEQVGTDVLHSLHSISVLYKPTVQHANFVVLRSPDVPSILVETAFISDPHDEHLLATQHYRDELASAILRGIKRYFQTTPPPGTWFAAQRAKRLGHRDAALATVAHTPSRSRHGAAASWQRHRVSRGETLSGLAQRYGVSIETIKNANHLDSDTLRAGRMLSIPTS